MPLIDRGIRKRRFAPARPENGQRLNAASLPDATVQHGIIRTHVPVTAGVPQPEILIVALHSNASTHRIASTRTPDQFDLDRKSVV